MEKLLKIFFVLSFFLFSGSAAFCFKEAVPVKGSQGNHRLGEKISFKIGGGKSYTATYNLSGLVFELAQEKTKEAVKDFEYNFTFTKEGNNLIIKVESTRDTVSDEETLHVYKSEDKSKIYASFASYNLFAPEGKTKGMAALVTAAKISQ